jgi:hypothetical protein
VGIKFNDQHIPDSPYKLFISPAMGDAHKLEVFQFPSNSVQADKPAAFLVRKNGAKGELDAKVNVKFVTCIVGLEIRGWSDRKHCRWWAITQDMRQLKPLKLLRDLLVIDRYIVDMRLVVLTAVLLRI